MAKKPAKTVVEETAAQRKRRLAAVKDMPKKLKTMTTRTVEFDRDKAEAWLQLNKTNRRVRKSHVNRFADLMDSGEFKLTSQGISISKRGHLQDGQHRLMAVIEYFNRHDGNGQTAKPVSIRVTEGEEENFAFFDQGVNRTTADVFEMEGIDNSAETANAARLLWIRFFGKRVAGAGKVTPYHLYEFIKDFDGFEDSVQFIMQFGKSEDSLPCKDLMSPGYAAALHYLMCHATDMDGNKYPYASSKANTFWTAVIEQDAAKGTQMYNLYRKIKKVKASKEQKLTRDALVDYCVQAMCKYLDDDTSPLRLTEERYFLGGLDGAGMEVMQDEEA